MLYVAFGQALLLLGFKELTAIGVEADSCYDKDGKDSVTDSCCNSLVSLPGIHLKCKFTS